MFASGFAVEKAAPKCSDLRTIELLRSIAESELVRTGYPTDKVATMRISIESIRGQGIDKGPRKQECACDLILEGPSGKERFPIKYTSELTNDNREFFVAVSGLNANKGGDGASARDRKNGDARADLCNARIAMETYLVDNGTFEGATTEKLLGNPHVYGLHISPGVELRLVTATKDSYVLETYHSEGTKKYVVEGPRGTIMEQEK
jgi:hypothetical protein